MGVAAVKTIPPAIALIAWVGMLALMQGQGQPTRPLPTPAAASQPTSRSDATTQPVPARRRIHFFVTGRVQAVGFRDHTRRAASALAVTGWVRNLKDGRVEGVAEGSPAAIDKLLAQVRRGPPGARVEEVQVADEKPTGQFRFFTIQF